MNFRMQRFNAAVHHFGEARVVRDLDDVDALIAEQMTGTTCRENFDTAMDKGLREFNDAGFIGDTDQGAPQRRQSGIVHVLSLPFVGCLSCSGARTSLAAFSSWLLGLRE